MSDGATHAPLSASHRSGHSLSVVHGWQVALASHTGRAAGQSAPVRHSTQAPPAPQWVVPVRAEQSFSMVHGPQVPA